MSQETAALNIILSRKNNIYVGITRSDFISPSHEKTSYQVKMCLEKDFFNIFSNQTHKFRSDFCRLLAVRVDIYLGRKKQEVLTNFGKTLRALREDMKEFVAYVDALVKSIAKVIRSKIKFNYKKLKKTSKRKKALLRAGWIEKTNVVN